MTLIMGSPIRSGGQPQITQSHGLIQFGFVFYLGYSRDMLFFAEPPEKRFEAGETGRLPKTTTLLLSRV